MNNTPVIEVKNLFVEFKTHSGIVRAVNDLSYKVMPGQTLGIVGESGSGKSVSSMAVMGLLPKTANIYTGPGGYVRVNGKDILGLDGSQMRTLRGNTMSMIFQDPMTSLNPYRKISSQMIEAIMFHKNISKVDALKKATELLDYVQLPDANMSMNSYPHELSGGMRQRVMIAMALMNDPGLIFADEPTTALDVTVQAQILDIFKEIQTNFKTSIVLISHDLGVIASECDEVLVMYAGRAMEIADPNEIFMNPRHPYTQALKKSIPSLHASVDEGALYTLPGNPPALLNLKEEGCAFAPRCEFANDKCLEGQIELSQIKTDHFNRCINI